MSKILMEPYVAIFDAVQLREYNVVDVYRMVNGGIGVNTVLEDQEWLLKAVKSKGMKVGDGVLKIGDWLVDMGDGYGVYNEKEFLRLFSRLPEVHDGEDGV